MWCRFGKKRKKEGKYKKPLKKKSMSFEKDHLLEGQRNTKKENVNTKKL